MIYTEPRIREQSFLEEYEAPLFDTLNAAAEDALHHSPTSAIYRLSSLAEAEHGHVNIGGAGFTPPDSPLVDAATARKRIKDEGLDLTVPDTGIRSRALDMLIDRKRVERRRQDVLTRGPSTTGATVARLGTALGASVLDPLNVASAFVPVVGEARYAALLARAGGTFGRIGVRAGVGAVEGAAGAALVEPLIYAAARQDQADYDLTDSLLNIAFGTVIGGGLHVGAGAIGDAIGRGMDWRAAKARATEPVPAMIDRMDVGMREAALRGGVSQAMSGRAIDVEPLIRGEPAVRVEPTLSRPVTSSRDGVAVATPERRQRPDDPAAISTREFAPERQALADIPAARAADDIVATKMPDEVAELLDTVMRDVTALARQMGDETAPARALASFDELSATAVSYGRAVKAAAQCQLRRGAA